MISKIIETICVQQKVGLNNQNRDWLDGGVKVAVSEEEVLWVEFP